MTCPRKNHWYAIVSAKIDEENRLAKHSMNKNNEIDEHNEVIIKKQEISINIVRLCQKPSNKSCIFQLKCLYLECYT
jgi:hypothetical protein